MATTDILHIEGALKPQRPAMAFLGGATDDYVQVNAAGAGMVAAAYTSGTFIAWIMPEDRTQTGTIVGAGDDNVVEFIELNIEAGKVVARCTDATVAAWVVTTTNEVAPPHKWTHVALVHDGTQPLIYINGELVAQSFSTSTDLTKWFSVTLGVDTMRIGAANKAGNASVTQEFGGMIGEVKLYGGTTTVGALTAAQVKGDYNRDFVTDNLYNHWQWGDRLLTDVGTGDDAGTIVGAVVYDDSGCEFTSRVRIAGLVTADYPVMAVHGESAHVLVIKAA